MVEASLYFFGVADLAGFEGLLDDAELRAELRKFLRSEHLGPAIVAACAAGVADHDTQSEVGTQTEMGTQTEVGTMVAWRQHSLLRAHGSSVIRRRRRSCV